VKCFKPCETTTGTKEVCEDQKKCSISSLRDNFWKFSDYLCLMKRNDAFVGICCSDDKTKSNDANENARRKVMDDSVEDAEERGCGISAAKFSKIAGGVETGAREHPWMAALITRKNSSSPFCGGTLVSDRHVLSAAHCTNRIKIQDLWIRLGEYSFETVWETRAKSFRAAEIRIHSDFNTATYENDIALIKLLRPATFSSYVWPICLPSANDDSFEGRNARVIGYGSSFFGGPVSPVLMEVTVPILKNSVCQTKYLHRISDTVLCAGAPNADSCQGDSG
jgi:serine protease 56